MKDEKILKKISKLLSAYGVSEEEKDSFIQDLIDFKDDEEETETETEEVVETETETETETEAENEIETEEVESESTQEAENEADNEIKESYESLAARIEALENIISKLGTLEKEEDSQFGVEPTSEGSKDDTRDYFEYINNRRTKG